MKNSRNLNFASMLFLTYLCGSFLVAGSAAPEAVNPIASFPALEASQTEPFPDASIPGMPQSGNWCLTRVEKSVVGKAEYISAGNDYDCEGGHTWRGKVKINTTLQASGRSCDQGDFIPNGSVLLAEGETIRRLDGFAHFAGQFVIKSADKPLFEGRMELYFAVGSHASETCDDLSHFEGWLVGRGGKRAPLSLRAMLSGKWTAPMPRIETSRISASILSGIVVRPK